jgi:hypothetical protein
VGRSLAAAVVAALLLAGSEAGAQSAPRQFQIYSVTTAEQFLNHADDRARGFGDNPFGNFKAPTATTKERRGGPFPGDQAVFAFALYPTPKHANPKGSAIFTCFYNFKQHGYCDAIYELKGGSILASGGVDFTSKDYSLIATGGTGAYRGVSGTVESKTVGYALTRLTFKLGS